MWRSTDTCVSLCVISDRNDVECFSLTNTAVVRATATILGSDFHSASNKPNAEFVHQRTQCAKLLLERVPVNVTHYWLSCICLTNDIEPITWQRHLGMLNSIHRPGQM